MANVTVTNNGATVNNDGKIGKCYEFNGSSKIICDLSNTITSPIGTLACWVKFKNMPSSSYFFDLIQVGNLGGYATCLFGFYMEYTNYINISINGSSTGTNRYTHSLQTNTWYHIATTYDGTIVKLYIDGNEVFSKTATISSYNTAASHIYLGGTSSYYLNGYMNDARWYDEALSPKQIKLLSQGLVLHYPLSDPFIEGTTNLITSEDCLSSTCYNGATSKYGYGANSDIYKTVTTFDGKKGTKVYMGTNGNQAYPYVYINNMYTSNGTNSPAYKTLSFDYYTNISTSISPYKLGSGSGTATYRVINDTIKTGTGTNSVVIPVKPNTWNHIEVTFHGTTDADSQWGYIQNQPSHTSNTENFWFFANMQLEAKDHATGYTKYSTSRSETTVYDVSGYCNNGTINGALTVSNNTPKYRFATIFDGNTASIKIPFNDMVKDKNYTISVWTYKSQIGTKNYQTILGGPSGFELEARSSSNTSPLFRIHNWGGGTTPYEFDKWYHFCFVHTDTDSKLYINGELKITGTSVNVPTGNYFIGAWNTATAQNYDGLMSDFRIYTTALSADDILELYNTPVHLTSNGALLTSGELTEV